MAETASIGSILKTYVTFVKTSTFHRAELMSVQWLRGLAVLMVLVFHVEDVARTIPGFENFHSFWVRFGYSAPDLFFVISGFIMCYVTFGMRFEPTRWLISRVLRIYPMYMLFTGLACIVWMINPTMTMGSGEQTWFSVLKSFFIVPQAGLPLVFVGWTVEHEIVFYALVFLVASLGGGLRGIVATTGVLSFLAVGRYLLQDAYPVLRFWDYHFLSLFMVQFFMGTLIFLKREQLKKLGSWFPALCSIALFIAGGFFTQTSPLNEETLGRVLIFGSSFSMLLIAALNIELDIRAKMGDAYPPRKRPFLVQAGDASYSIYLVHPFALSAGGKILVLSGVTGLPAAILVCLLGCVTVGLGLAFYTLVEKPFLLSMKGVMSGPKKDVKPPPAEAKAA